jgi:hypothetical protein
VVRLEDLAHRFGGQVRTLGARSWLDTRVGGLRTFVIRRVTEEHTVAFELAVFMKRSKARDPFFELEWNEEWKLEGKDEVPALRHGFVFAGCHRGVLFARNTTPPSLDTLVATLWELVDWARHDWLRIIYVGTPKKWTERLRDSWARRDEWPEWVRVLGTLVFLLLVFWFLLR